MKKPDKPLTYWKELEPMMMLKKLLKPEELKPEKEN
jgi:hypothetical protein